MEGERSETCTIVADVREGEASTLQTASAAGDADELSALEALPSDVLAEVLQQLGFAEASRVRAASRSMRDAIDCVAWRSLRVVARSVEQIERAAASFGHPRRPENAQRACTYTRRDRVRVRTGKGCTLEVVVQCSLGDQLGRALESLFSACSASSGGLGVVRVRVVYAHAYAYAHLSAATAAAADADRNKTAGLVESVLKPLSDNEADGGSSHTLKCISCSINISGHDQSECRRFRWHMGADADASNGLTQLISCFRSVEHLQLPHECLLKAAAISKALPALRSVSVRFSDEYARGGGLAAFASHPALEELHISLDPYLRLPFGFEAFAEGPAARLLRKLSLRGGPEGSDDFAPPLPALARLASLEELQLFVSGLQRPAPDTYSQALAGLSKLRELRLRAPHRQTAASLRDLARAVAALRACSLDAVHLEIVRVERGDEAEVDAALAELLRAAGPALLDLRIEGSVLRGHAAAALRTCSRLRRLELSECTPHASVVETAGVLAACPSLQLKGLQGLCIPFDDERGAIRALDSLRRLAAACRLGDGAGCSFYLRPGESLQGQEQVRLRRLLKQRVRFIFPKADVVFGL